MEQHTDFTLYLKH